MSGYFIRNDHNNTVCFGVKTVGKAFGYWSLQVMANDIQQPGMQPALWMCTLCSMHEDKPNRLLPLIPGRDDTKQPVPAQALMRT